MKLFIKNMVCDRCKLVVKNELERKGVHPVNIVLGEVELKESVSPGLLNDIAGSLRAVGFELIDDKKSRIIEKIKNLVVELIHYTDEQPREKQSEYIARELHYDYSYLSRLFSDVEGITIEQYTINQKIEKIKEYIVYEELSLSEIADRMGYSSVAHLSAQFKKATGLPPSHFKNIGIHQRRSLDNVGRR